MLLAGPTASGKTSLSIQLARALRGRFAAEIVNADSMQLYRRMDVGTAKPTPEERALVAHHLLDIVEPDEPFDAAKYLAIARPKLEELGARTVLPLVVGGTGLYMRALTRGLCPGPPSDPEVKARLLALENSRGLDHLYEQLLLVDRQSAAKIHRNDRQRIIRALEVFHVGGVALSVLQSGHGFKEELFPTVKIFVSREREALYERIDRRVEQMIEQGLAAEVEALLSAGFGPELKSMRSIGYRQMAAHLAGKISLDEAVFEMKRETRRYAKRQITWFVGDGQYRCFDARDLEGMARFIRASLEGARDE